MRLSAVLHVLSLVLLLFAASMLVPLAFSLVLADGAYAAYAKALGVTLLAGGALRLATLRAGRELQVRDGFLLVALVWTVLPAFATLPLLLVMFLGVLLITHYTRILRYIEPDFVHVFVDGRIVREGGPELAKELEADGYEAFIPEPVGGES